MRPILTRFQIALLAAAGLVLALASTISGQTPPVGDDGAKIFARTCAPCHGDGGKGGAGYAKPLVGILSMADLGHFILTQMPPGDRKKLSEGDADKVAAYMYDAFYSPIAQERNRPARIALSRLTVRQYKNAVADLISGFHPAIPDTKERGLNGTYFKGRDFDDKEKVLERRDANIKFDFGVIGPTADGFDPYNFSIAWEGSVIAPDTGDYTFILRSNQAVRLFVNDEAKPVVDGWVKSANDDDSTGSIELLGGRAYHVRIEFSKATSGVNDDEKKKKIPPGKAFVSFLWKRPRMATEIVPTRYLIPQWTWPTYVVDTAFPDDDRSTGYERGASVSKEWNDATTSAALDAADYVATHLERVTGVREDAPDKAKKLKEFAHHLVERAFARPLSLDEEALYIEKQFAGDDAIASMKRVIVLTLLSPRFLDRGLGSEKPDAYARASELSFALWDTLPDDPLYEAARANKLTTDAQLRAQADRMASDPRGWFKTRQFLFSWLRVDDVPDVVKSDKVFPTFSATTVSELRNSLDLSLESIVTSPGSDYRQLFESPKLFLNDDLGKLYGAPIRGDDYRETVIDSGKRSGVLTHPYLLSRFAYLETTSPIHRGVLILRNLLGRTLSPPPAAFVPLPASSHPDLTTRERVSLQTKPAMCNACHSRINPLGFTLEKFDAIGRLRTTENQKPINSAGSYVASDGKVVTFSGAADLGKYLAESSEAHRAFEEKLFHAVLKQPVLAYGPKTLDELDARFRKNHYSIRKLMIDIAIEGCQGKD